VRGYNPVSGILQLWLVSGGLMKRRSAPHSLRDSALSLSIFGRLLKTLCCKILPRCTLQIRDFIWECAV